MFAAIFVPQFPLQALLRGQSQAWPTVVVDDEVLPYLSLAVDGLTEAREGKKGKLELRPEDLAANEENTPDTTMPVATLDEDQFVEVYGWETSWWKKIKGYFGF